MTWRRGPDRIDPRAVRLMVGLAGIAVGALILVVLAFAAHAAAPPPDSEQGRALAPYAEWVRGLTNPTTGQGCCSLADCRIIDYRISADGAGYEAFLDRKAFPDGPNAWVRVPDYVVVHKANPTGFAVACWAAWHKKSRGWYCFTPSSGA